MECCKPLLIFQSSDEVDSHSLFGVSFLIAFIEMRFFWGWVVLVPPFLLMLIAFGFIVKSVLNPIACSAPLYLVS